MVMLKEKLRELRVIPVLRLGDHELAHQGANWLVEAGLGAIEVTMTIPHTATLIEKLRGEHPNVLIGAGTVLNTDDAQAVISAGAQFIVTPCLVPEVAEACRSADMPLLAGAATPREVLLAHQAGSMVVKIFPAKSSGGPSFIKALKAVFPEIDLMPTGGVLPQEVSTYLQAGALCTGLGSEFLPVTPLREGNKAAFLATVQTALAQIHQ